MMQLLNTFVSRNWHSGLVIDMPCLLWDTASGCHGNCISCLGAPGAVASLAQSNVTSHICLRWRQSCLNFFGVLSDMSARTINGDRGSWSKHQVPRVSNWMRKCCSACVAPRLCSLSGGIHTLEDPEVAGVHGGAGPRLKVSWASWCSRPAGSLLQQDVQPIEEQLGLLLKWSLHSSGKSVFALRLNERLCSVL